VHPRKAQAVTRQEAREDLGGGKIPQEVKICGKVETEIREWK